MAQHNITGSSGEQIAVKYFIEKGYLILHTNWRHKHWEVDIIASLKNKLHFIEVKTRWGNTFGNPEDDVSKKKIRNLINAADEFLFMHPEWKHIQFDIISISMQKDKAPDFYLIEDVYLP